MPELKGMIGTQGAKEGNCGLDHLLSLADGAKAGNAEKFSDLIKESILFFSKNYEQYASNKKTKYMACLAKELNNEEQVASGYSPKMRKYIIILGLFLDHSEKEKLNDQSVKEELKDALKKDEEKPTTFGEIITKIANRYHIPDEALMKACNALVGIKKEFEAAQKEAGTLSEKFPEEAKTKTLFGNIQSGKLKVDYTALKVNGKKTSYVKDYAALSAQNYIDAEAKKPELLNGLDDANNKFNTLDEQYKKSFGRLLDDCFTENAFTASEEAKEFKDAIKKYHKGPLVEGPMDF